MVEILTKIQGKKFVKEEVERQIIPLYKELDKLFQKINLLREEFVCFMDKEVNDGKRET